MGLNVNGDQTKAQVLADIAFLNKVTRTRKLSFNEKKAIAVSNEFVPATPGNWSTGPETQDEALNELAARTSAGNDIANLVTLTGVAVDSTSLGTFTGTTIADSQTIKAAIQALETALEAQKPSHVVKFAGKTTVNATDGGDNSLSLTVTGVLATDIVMATFETADAASIATALVATPSADTITISGTLTENDVIAYTVLRALA
jgi:hypothetical protein